MTRQRRWRSGTAARRPGGSRRRPKARGPTPPRAITPATHSGVELGVALRSCGHSRPGNLTRTCLARRKLPAWPKLLTAAQWGPGAAAARLRARWGSLPDDRPARARLAQPAGAVRPGPAGRAGPEGSPFRRSASQPKKPKVYQGVRVKITVKEMLQQRRAHQAASGGTLSGGNSVHLSDPVTPPSSGQYIYFEPDSSSSTPNCFQPQEFSSCVSCEENPSCLDQILDSYLQTETHPDPFLNSMQSAPHYFQDSFQAAPFCFNQSLTPGSPSDTSTLSGSLDHSYSPVHLPSYAAENYNSSPSLDARNCGYPSEDYSYPHLPSYAQYDCFFPAPTSGCYCVSCEAEHLATIRTSEYFSYPSTDCVNFDPMAAATSDFYMKETNFDICYSS
ncbi:POU class 2 homeobox associating factor 3 [Pteronotus mesoamericanus]|uniref:POU class 2 homeobox associating factor 3 n=1 Tax=Pteronotus mesoamericanus TaxID=1884717 RepID=UPI0023ED6E35|nr:POU class 2 homeobox associating factor 3 [Pteronotus parnellii mesoamericanus]